MQRTLTSYKIECVIHSLWGGCERRQIALWQDKATKQILRHCKRPNKNKENTKANNFKSFIHVARKRIHLGLRNFKIKDHVPII